jgi:NAD(P)-dependent dehydrogenase (short-subunit alcohol dehydrogenase family)
VDEIKGAGGEAVANYDSVSTVEGGENIIKAATDTFGKLDIVVNNAGILRDKMFFNMTEEEWDAVIAVHLKGHFCVTKPAAVIMREQKSGRIINFTSHAGLQGNAGQANYAAAKAGIVGFTRTLSLDLAKYNVTVNVVSPMAWTRLVATVPGMQEPPGWNAEFVGPIVVYLASDEAQDVNGQVVTIRGNKIALISHPREIAAAYTDKEMWTPQDIAKVFPSALKPWMMKTGIQMV